MTTSGKIDDWSWTTGGRHGVHGARISCSLGQIELNVGNGVDAGPITKRALVSLAYRHDPDIIDADVEHLDEETIDSFWDGGSHALWGMCHDLIAREGLDAGWREHHVSLAHLRDACVALWHALANERDARAEALALNPATSKEIL